MFKSLASYFTRKAVERQASTRKKLFLTWDKIEKIALIIDNAQAFNKSELDKFIEGTKKYIDVYFLELNSKTGSFNDWICFTSKNKTFLGLPKSHVDSSLKNRNYQLVINASQKYELFAVNLVAKIHSPYNCGCNDLFGAMDLVIVKDPLKNTVDFLKDVKKYLEMIKTN